MAALFKRVTYTFNYTISANSQLAITGNDFNMVAIEGYLMAAVLRATSAKDNVDVVRIFPQMGVGTSMMLYNRNNSNQSGTARMDILYTLEGCLTTVN